MTSGRSGAAALLLIGALGVAAAWPIPATAADEQLGVSRELRERAVGVLRQVLEQDDRPARLLAAEILLSLDYSQGVTTQFSEQRTASEEDPPYRIGTWRVLVRAAYDEERRGRWIGKIREVALDRHAPDRLDALKSLAEFGYSIRKEGDDEFRRAAFEGDGPLAAYAAWVLVHSGREDAEARLAELLHSDNPATRAAAAHAPGHPADVLPAIRAGLPAALECEPANSPARVHLLAAALAHWPADQDERKAALEAELARSAGEGTREERLAACEALAEIGTRDDLPLLTGLLDDAGAEIRVLAACAILRIGRRATPGMASLDWLVLGAYAAGMIAVGLYYSRRTVTTDDYLLGGRTMRPLAVGLSLFATLLSTITYLAWPGEMIRYGPMMLGMVVAYPFVFFCAGWFMIPFIMKLRITSAYEILETRLGLSVRMLGSCFFLAMRLMWMALIIFATTDKVLVPTLGLDPSATPYICVVLGLITLAYTSMGGLRAVVFTDVVQTLILLGAALLTMVLVTVDLGGVGGWWPSQWPVHWPQPEFGFGSGTGTRVTFTLAVLAHFTWWVSTAGSDQMAVQRYLATRNVKAARGVLFTSLAANTLVALVLSVVGLALLAYFRLNPHFIPDGQTILSDPDTLFPRFIAFGLPVGLSGLVVAGMLAAAMSSLSSGVNSSCSVITVDFIDRFRKRKDSETDHVRLAKYIAVLVGLAVIVLSTGVGMVEGNLLEVAFKVVNLLTVPLFGLFFMAMFVRWATGPGTLVGAVAGLAVVVAINYWREITGTQGISFLWGMPLSLVAQIAVGSLASLVPIGRRAAAAE